VERKVADARKRLDDLEKMEARDREGRERWKLLARELDIKEHEMRLLQEQVEGSNATRVSRHPYSCSRPTLTSNRSEPKSRL
jgi:structural maintenance of chromosome 2